LKAHEWNAEDGEVDSKGKTEDAEGDRVEMADTDTPVGGVSPERVEEKEEARDRREGTGAEGSGDKEEEGEREEEEEEEEEEREREEEDISLARVVARRGRSNGGQGGITLKSEYRTVEM
jgi:hypothetical protein